MLDWLQAHGVDPGNIEIGLLVVFGYPAIVLATLELSRRFTDSNAPAADVLHKIAVLLCPAGAIWLILRVLADMPPGHWAVRSAETAFALTGLYLLLRVGQAFLMTTIGDQARAPKLLFDALRIGLSLVWSAVVVSRIWHVDLGSLFAAVGVGSIVLGFALQEFLGNLLSGLQLLSARKFGIGDWILVDGSASRVIEMDWHTVTLIKSSGDRVIVANSSLAKGNLTIVARQGEATTTTVQLSFGADIPPEQVRAAVIEAAGSMPRVVASGGVRCFVAGISAGDGTTASTVNYTLLLPIPDPGSSLGPRDEFLSRLWYVAQRRGLRLPADPTSPCAVVVGGGELLERLRIFGSFHNNTEMQKRIVAAGSYRRYRRGEALISRNQAAPDAMLVLAGMANLVAQDGGGETRLEQLGPGQLLVLQQTLIGRPSPVHAVAETDSEVLAIPAALLLQVMEEDRVIARDVRALAEARRLAILSASRGLRAAA